MGNAIYCETRPSSVPFVFENTQVTVYSYEEACFYIFQNASMITRDQLGTEFIEWVKNNLEMEELAQKLQELWQSGAEWKQYLETFLLAANYYEKEEIALLFERMKEEEQLPVAYRLKRQADNFVRFHKYLKAVHLYDEILKRQDLSKELKAQILHNKGVAYSKNWNLEEAGKCFLKAYDSDHNELSLSCYFSTLFLEGKEEEAKKQCTLLEVSEETYERIFSEYKRSLKLFEKSEQYVELQKMQEEYKNREVEKADQRMKRLLHTCKDEFCIQNR